MHRPSTKADEREPGPGWPVIVRRGLLPLIGFAVIAATSYGIAAAGRGGLPARSVVMLRQQPILRHPAASHLGSGHIGDRHMTSANLNLEYVHPDIETPPVNVFPDVPLLMDRPAPRERLIAELDHRQR